MRPLVRIALGHALRRPLQSALLVLGVALGVAVVVAIDLANSSALSAFRLSTEAVSGRATHRVVGGPGGLDEDVYRRLRVEAGVRASAPVVEGLVTAPALDGQPLTLLGLDPFAEPPFRGFLSFAPGAGASDARGGADAGPASGGAPLTAFLTEPGAAFLSRDLAGRMGVAPGDLLPLQAGSRTLSLTVAGLLEPEDELSRRALSGLVVVDVSTAQEALDGLGRLSRIDLLLPDDAAARDAVRARVERVLPPGAQIVPAGDEQATVASMTEAFRLNLTALSLLALLVGVFLIFNTVRFSVVQRRPVIGTLRALGVTRREIFGMILAEAAVLGTLGALLGLGLGVVLGRGAVALVTRTITELYFVVSVRDVPLPLMTLVRGAGLGVLTALGAALLPAVEATAVPPVTTRRRSAEEQRARALAPLALIAAGLSMAIGAGLLALPGERVDIGFAGLAAVVVGFALAVPAVTLGLMRVARPVAGRLFGPVGRMAPRDVTRALSRTAVAIAALMVAVCVSVGVSTMVGSFRITVVDWLDRTLQADVFLRPPSLTAARTENTLDPALVDELRARPAVIDVATARSITVRAPALGPVELVAVRRDLAGPDRRYLDAVGSPAAVWAAMSEGAVVVSEPFARRYDRGVGDRLTLLTDAGPRPYPIAGVYYDYGSERGTVLMADAVYRAGWDDPAVTSIALTLAPEADADAVAEVLRAQYAGREQLVVQSTRGLRAEVLAVFDRAFAITGALQLLAIVIAFIGVLSALMALQLERAREFATLRATGMTQRQLGGLSLLETGLMGGVAGLLSWPAGLTLALILIYVINRRSFGWTIQTHLQAEVFLRALGVAVLAALLAGVYPALRLSRLPVARSLREE